MSQPAVRLATVNIDCDDAAAMAEFYGRLLGWEVGHREADYVILRNPTGGTGLSFQAEAAYRRPTWPETPDGLDKMLHLDLHVDDLAAAVSWARECGAQLAEQQPQPGVTVMFDPAGHPFCLFTD